MGFNEGKKPAEKSSAVRHVEARRCASDLGTTAGQNAESTATRTFRLCQKSAKKLLIVHAVVPILVNRLNLRLHVSTAFVL